jgi:hypothetical protein
MYENVTIPPTMVTAVEYLSRSRLEVFDHMTAQ